MKSFGDFQNPFWITPQTGLSSVAMARRGERLCIPLGKDEEQPQTPEKCVAMAMTTHMALPSWLSTKAATCPVPRVFVIPQERHLQGSNPQGGCAEQSGACEAFTVAHASQLCRAQNRQLGKIEGNETWQSPAPAPSSTCTFLLSED